MYKPVLCVIFFRNGSSHIKYWIVLRTFIIGWSDQYTLQPFLISISVSNTFSDKKRPPSFHMGYTSEKGQRMGQLKSDNKKRVQTIFEIVIPFLNEWFLLIILLFFNNRLDTVLWLNFESHNYVHISQYPSYGRKYKFN